MNCFDPAFISSSPGSQPNRDLDDEETTGVMTIMNSSSFPSIPLNRAPLNPRLKTSQLLRTDRPGAPPDLPSYINTCDKVSISEICHDVESLNSSIRDIVDALIEKKFQRRGINLRQGVKRWEQSGLVKVAWQHTTKKEIHMRRPIFDALLHDLITGFVNSILEDDADSISPEFKHFRRTATRVMTVEQFMEAQNWKRIAAGLFDPPLPETWDALSQELVYHIERGCWPILGKSPNGWKRLFRRSDGDRFSSLIRSAYDLTMKINRGIFSESLSIVTAERDEEFDLKSAEVLQELEVRQSNFFPCLGQRTFVLGNRGFGLVGNLEGGSEKIYIKVPITSGRPKAQIL